MKRIFYYFLLILTASVLFNLHVNKYDYEQAIPGIFFQLFGSLILGFVCLQFYQIFNRGKSNWLKWWLVYYAFMVVTSIIILILGIYPID